MELSREIAYLRNELVDIKGMKDMIQTKESEMLQLKRGKENLLKEIKDKDDIILKHNETIYTNRTCLKDEDAKHEHLCKRRKKELTMSRSNLILYQMKHNSNYAEVKIRFDILTDNSANKNKVNSIYSNNNNLNEDV